MTENENRIEELTSTSSTQTNHSSPPPPPPPLISISLPDCDSSSSSSSEEEEEFHETVEDPIELNLNSAETLKSEGNTHFGKSHWRDALNLYTQALLLLPLPHQTPSSSTSNQKKVSDSHSSSSSSEAEVLESEVDLKNSINDPDPRVTNLRSTLNANSAACHLKLVSLPLLTSSVMSHLCFWEKVRWYVDGSSVGLTFYQEDWKSAVEASTAC